MITLDEEGVRIEIRVTVEGKLIRHGHIIDTLDWEDMSPPRRLLLDPLDVYDAQQRAEKRRRMIDMLSGKIAYALFSAIHEKYKEDTKG